jgi:hypothetical protein
MSTLDRGRHASPSSRRGRRALAALTSVGLVSAGVVVATTGSASAAPVSVTGATFTWSVSAEMQSAPPFGGCNYMSAGESSGNQATYATTAGNVSILKNGAAPTWANKCEGAATGTQGQSVVWSGGTGTVDPATGASTLSFTGKFTINFYGGLVPFTIVDPVVTSTADGDGKIVATVNGYESSMENPTVKVPLNPVSGVVVADTTGVDAGATGYTVTPDYAGVTYDPPAGSGGTPQNRVNPGWGAWPTSFVDYHYQTGLTSYWYSSGGAADPKKAPAAFTIAYPEIEDTDPPVDPPVEPGEDEQTIVATVPTITEPGEFAWSIDGTDRTVTLTDAANQGTYLQSTGEIKPITVTDTRAGGPTWSVSGQVSDFTGDVPAEYLGWTPKINTPGAGATAGAAVASGYPTGTGLSASSTLASATAGHAGGTANLGADLDLRLPVDTEAGTYSATLTLTALS